MASRVEEWAEFVVIMMERTGEDRRMILRKGSRRLGRMFLLFLLLRLLRRLRHHILLAG